MAYLVGYFDPQALEEFRRDGANVVLQGRTEVAEFFTKKSEPEEESGKAWACMAFEEEPEEIYLVLRDSWARMELGWISTELQRSAASLSLLGTQKSGILGTSNAPELTHLASEIAVQVSALASRLNEALQKPHSK